MYASEAVLLILGLFLLRLALPLALTVLFCSAMNRIQDRWLLESGA